MIANFNFRCMDCKYNTRGREYYMLHDEVWLIANPKECGMLCIGCVEKRIGRSLRAEDFTDCPLNNDAHQPRSARLLSRMVS